MSINVESSSVRSMTAVAGAVVAVERGEVRSIDELLELHNINCELTRKTATISTWTSSTEQTQLARAGLGLS